MKAVDKNKKGHLLNYRPPPFEVKEPLIKIQKGISPGGTNKKTSIRIKGELGISPGQRNKYMIPFSMETSLV